MFHRLLPLVSLVASLAFAGCSKPADTSAQIQSIDDKLLQVEQGEQELQLQAERNALDSECAALEAERKSFAVQKAGFTPGSKANAPVLLTAASSGGTRRFRASDRYNGDDDPPAAGSDGDAGYYDQQQPPPSGGSYDVFYEGLQEGGQWFDDASYGYVWQPDVAAEDQSWRPYTDGYWVYTDRGWTWVSNESFGWACYHYGRWTRLRDLGWIWVPGAQWAPAWVSWRESDDDDYVGWAPLPPECEPSPQVRVQGWVDRYYDIGPATYVFLRLADLLRPSYRQVVLPPQQNVTLIERTRNITDIYYNNQSVNVLGPRYEQVVQQVNRPIPRYQIDYVTPSQPSAPFRTAITGNRLQVVAPPARLQPRATVAPRVTQTIQNAQVEKGWQNVDPNRARQIRQVLARNEPQVPKSLPPQPVPPPKPVVVERHAPGQAPVAGPASPGNNNAAAQRANLEAERARLEQQKQALEQHKQPSPQQVDAQRQPPGAQPFSPGPRQAQPPQGPPGAAQRQAEQQQQRPAEQGHTPPHQQPGTVDQRELEGQKQQQLKAQQEAAQRQAEQQQAAAKQRELEAQKQQQLKAQQEAAQRQAAEQQRAQQAAAQRQAQAQQQQEAQRRAQAEAAQRQQAEQRQAEQQRAQQEAAQRQAAEQQRAHQEAAQRQAEAQQAAQRQAQAAAQHQAAEAAAQRQAQAAAAHQQAAQRAQAEKEAAARAAAEQRAKGQAPPAGQPQ